MKNIFKEYHQFSKEEFEELWEKCIFIFDTNTLLNMYRYSRVTVDTYFEVLKKLKKKKTNLDSISSMIGILGK